MKEEEVESIHEKTPTATPPRSPRLKCPTCGHPLTPSVDAESGWVCTSSPTECKDGKAEAGSNSWYQMQLKTEAEHSKK